MPDHAPTLGVLLVAAYLLASINLAILLSALGVIADPRAAGSGNPGVTNVYRVAGWRWAGVVLLLDLGRAAGIAALATSLVGRPWAVGVGCGFVLGNRFPLFHRFRGGKAVTASLGITAFVAPLMAAIACGAWVVIFALLRVPFMASFVMVGILAAGQILAGAGHPAAWVGSLISLALILAGHRSNVVARWGAAAPSADDHSSPGE